MSISDIGRRRQSNSMNMGPVWEHISISSDSTNNSSGSFLTIDLLMLKRSAPSSQCVPVGLWDDLSIHQSDISNHWGHVVWNSKDINRLSLKSMPSSSWTWFLGLRGHYSCGKKSTGRADGGISFLLDQFHPSCNANQITIGLLGIICNTRFFALNFTGGRTPTG
jgi:hypothetical protein